MHKWGAHGISDFLPLHWLLLFNLVTLSSGSQLNFEHPYYGGYLLQQLLQE
jgi:hypothetical protein